MRGFSADSERISLVGDAPMVVADARQGQNDLVMTPWVRVIRQEATVDTERSSRQRFYAVDIVHYWFLSAFIDEQLFPFAQAYADRASAKKQVLLRGGGPVADINDRKWPDVQG